MRRALAVPETPWAGFRPLSWQVLLTVGTLGMVVGLGLRAQPMPRWFVMYGGMLMLVTGALHLLAALSRAGDFERGWRVWAGSYFQDRLSARGGEMLVQCLEQERQTTGRYPDTLDRKSLPLQCRVPAAGMRYEAYDQGQSFRLNYRYASHPGAELRYDTWPRHGWYWYGSSRW